MSTKRGWRSCVDKAQSVLEMEDEKARVRDLDELEAQANDDGHKELDLTINELRKQRQHRATQRNVLR